MTTRARVLTLNCRNENAMELFPSRRWTRRRPHLIKFIKDCAPSVIGVQDARTTWRHRSPKGSGAELDVLGSGTAKIIRDAAVKWVAALINSRRDALQASRPH